MFESGQRRGGQRRIARRQYTGGRLSGYVPCVVAMMCLEVGGLGMTSGCSKHVNVFRM